MRTLSLEGLNGVYMTQGVYACSLAPELLDFRQYYKGAPFAINQRHPTSESKGGILSCGRVLDAM
jgi:hypothetical protein